VKKNRKELFGVREQAVQRGLSPARRDGRKEESGTWKVDGKERGGGGGGVCEGPRESPKLASYGYLSEKQTEEERKMYIKARKAFALTKDNPSLY